METNAKFLDYTDKTIRDVETNELLQGDVFRDGVIFRFFNGKLHSENEPAVETEDAHVEFWKHGRLHRNNGPAIICLNNKSDIKSHYHEEFWVNGVRI